MDLDSRIFTVGALVGMLLMLAAFVAYVVDPLSTYELIFVIGAVLLFGGYILKYMENRRSRIAYISAYEAGEENGFMIVLDEDYVPYQDCATIEDLREM